MIIDTGKSRSLNSRMTAGNGLCLNSGKTPRNICSHEKVVKHDGYTVCKSCGMCLETLYTDRNFIEDHRTLSVTTATQIGWGSADRMSAQFKRLRRLQRLSIPIIYGELYNNTKTLLANLGLHSKIHKDIYTYMCSIYKKIEKSNHMRGSLIFVPVVTYIALQNMKINVSKKEILKVSGISETKMNKGIQYLRIDLGLKRR